MAKAKVSKKLQQAIDSLVINDVYLKSAQAECVDNFDPKSADSLEALSVQQMHIVRKSEVIQVDGDGQLVRIYIRLGARWVSQQEEGDEPVITFGPTGANF